MLMDMLLNKVKTSVPAWRNKSNLELFVHLFPPEIKGRETLKYLLNFSHGRPRDIVNLLNRIINKYPESTCFQNEMFLDIEKDYSTNFCNELSNEMSLYCGSEYISACFSMLTLLRKNNFWKVELEQLLTTNRHLSVINDLDTALELLYRYGAIGNLKKITATDHRFYFRYREDGSTINDAEKFTIHFALRKAIL